LTRLCASTMRRISFRLVSSIAATVS
jgi:hypothetical protein